MDVPDPTHAVQLVFICQRAPDTEQADWSPEIRAIVEKLGAAHVYAHPMELPPDWRPLWAVGVEAPTEFPPDSKMQPGRLVWRHKESGEYATKGGWAALFPAVVAPPSDYDAVEPPEGLRTVDYRVRAMEGRLIPREEISEGDVRFLVELAEETLGDEPFARPDVQRRLRDIKARVAGAG